MAKKKLNILFIEDDEADAFLNMLELDKKMLDYNYKIIYDLDSFEKALKESDWDIILSDFSLPEFNAFELLNILRKSNKEIPFIVISGVIGEELAAKLMREGAHDFIKKDNLSRLVPAIERELQEFEINKENKKNQKMLEAVLSTNVSAIIVLNNNGEFIYANDKAEEILCLKKGEMFSGTFNSPDWKITDLNGNLIPDYDNPFMKVFKTGEPIMNLDFSLYLNNVRKFLSINASPLKDEKGSITSVVFSIDDITDRKLSEEKIKNSLEEKDLLIKEIHHRVKNNLQIISSKLHLQILRSKESNLSSILKEEQNCIKAMALIYQKIYFISNIIIIDFGNYSISLIKNLFSTFKVNNDKIKIIADISKDTYCSIDHAIPCGLILNELISNSIKYAFPEGNGEISVTISKQEKNCLLSVGDNGKGLPHWFDIKNVSSLGLQLVNELVLQLDGNLEIVNNNGVLFKIIFPSDERIPSLTDNLNYTHQ